jgi:hypothetical protein
VVFSIAKLARDDERLVALQPYQPALRLLGNATAGFENNTEVMDKQFILDALQSGSQLACCES